MLALEAAGPPWILSTSAYRRRGTKLGGGKSAPLRNSLQVSQLLFYVVPMEKTSQGSRNWRRMIFSRIWWTKRWTGTLESYQ